MACCYITTRTLTTALSSLSARKVLPGEHHIPTMTATWQSLTLAITGLKTSRQESALVSSLPWQ